MDAMKIANSIPMWIACGIPVILVIAQALIFAKKSYSAGKKTGLTEKQMKNAIKSSAITSIGPSIVILSGMLSLLITVGGPMAWMRLSLIGSVMFESIAAGFGTASVGVQLGADTLTPLALDMAVWTMILGSIDRMDHLCNYFCKPYGQGTAQNFRWRSGKTDGNFKCGYHWCI